MIDEKKIEEAAEKQLDDLGSYGLNEDELDRIGSFALYREEDVKESFKAGINWFLENLFHPSDETPKVGKEYLLKATFFNDEGDSFDAYVTSTFGIDGWKEDFFPRGYDLEVKEWACIDDLLKGGK